MQFTPLQQNAIGLQALGKDACVVAGPGSGKTTVLIERFRGLVESGVPPLRILAITFTEKATNNMRQRIAKAFAAQPGMLSQIPQAWVSTVDGFCTRLLKENAIFAAVDPRFRVLNEQEFLALQQTAVSDALDGFFADDPDAVRKLLHALESPAPAAAILTVYNAMRAAGKTIEDLWWSQPPGGGRMALDGLLSHVERIRAERYDDWSPAQKQHLAQILEWGARLRGRHGQQTSRRDFEILAGFECNLRKLKSGTAGYDLIKQLRQQLIPAAEAALAADFYAPQRETLLAAMVRFDKLYRARKEAESALDFADLEELSVRLLAGNAAVAARVRGQFDHILMDEFQDTNGLQAGLLELLRPAGCFYAVGDINQSIYGFRHADPDVFRDYRNHIQREGEHLAELRENWRSRKPILDAVTALLGHAGGIEPHTLQAVQEFAPKAEPSVEVMACVAKDTGSASALEARWVACRIRELHGSLVLKEGPAHFGDMAVLVRKADSIQPFTDAFREAGIPYVVTAGKGFFEAREVVDLVHLLRVLANPRDELSLAAVLRSPLAGVSDETLLRMKQIATLGDALERVDQIEDSESLRRFARDLAAWREARDFISPDRLLVRAMDAAGYEARLDERARANVAKFLSFLRDAGMRRSLDDLIDDLARLRLSDPREQDSQTEDSGDVVRVLTIHAAKGLEFPVVFLPALHAGVSGGGSPLLFSPRLGLGVRWRNPADGDPLKDTLYRAIGEEVRQKEAGESNRLLYVGMTRAQEHLVLSCSSAGKSLPNWAGLLQSAWALDLTTPRDDWRIEQVNTGLGVRVLCTSSPPSPLPPAPPAHSTPPLLLVQPAAAAEQYDSTAPVTSIALFAHCPRRYYLARYLGWEGGRLPLAVAEDEQDQADHEAMDATDFGTLVHRLLAGVPPDGAPPEALRLARRFCASDIGRRAHTAPRVEREFDFLVAIEEVVLRGQIDLWFEDGSGRVIVDYKTDDIDAAEVPARTALYTLQLQLYALALDRMDGRVPGSAWLYFLRPDVAMPVDLSAGSLAEAARAVRRFRQAQDHLRFPLNEGRHCHRCPFFRGQCLAGVGVE